MTNLVPGTKLVIMEKKVLVTGGAGFIGSHIVDLLIKNNYKVVIVDDLSSGREENVNKNARFYKLNITDQMGLTEVFKQEKPDYVCHEAAQISVSFSVRDPLFDAQTNILGSLNLLQCCLMNQQVKGIVFASSGGTIYGEPEHFPITEDYPFRPQSPYGISKVAVEHYLDFYQKNYHLDYVSLRYGNVYGPRQDPYGEAGVIAIFIEKMLKGEIPTINGDGEYIRDYVYVEDVAQANLLALQNMVKLSKVVREKEKAKEKEKEIEGEGEAAAELKFNGLNLGTGRGVSVNEIFSLLKVIIKFPNPAHYGPPRAGDLRKNILDCRLISEVLGWQSQFDFSAGLEKTVHWFKENI
ncbi:MAG: NAD-dependent epimerase/dehydratase family protein [Atribacterota bacterium]|nr:NAD-dependent epimerase/dehydratase family protein [Atribacterota bacterium]